MARIILVLAGLFWIVIGIFGLVATKRLTLTLSNFVKNTPRQNLGLFGLIFGALLLISAPHIREAWFVLALGIIACLKGAAVVLMPKQKLNEVMDWWLAAPEVVLKGWAVCSLILGVVMFFII